jgi:thiamine-phosphate pyrophosphorylase
MLSKGQYISQGNTAEEQVHNIRAALDAGVTWVQLRYKKRTEPEVSILAGAVKQYCSQYKATFIVNDWITVAKAVDADGVHLGLTDSPVQQARELLGNKKIIGGTANTLAHIYQRLSEGCDYVGVGPFRFTPTKENLSPIVGLEGYRVIVQALEHSGHSIPLYAIGGITVDDADALKAAGLYGICLSAGVTTAIDKRETIRLLHHKMYE